MSRRDFTPLQKSRWFAFMIRLLPISLLICFLVSCSKYQIGHAILGMPSTKIKVLSFDEKPSLPDIKFVFPDSKTDPYLSELRQTYELDKQVSTDKTDLDKVLSILHWTHLQWEHNGSNEPSKPDAITILKETELGKKFRCVEYGIVVTDAMLAIGLKARVLGLKSRDVETCKSSAGHVLAEVWLKEFKKWAILDAQFDMMPVLEGKPLNAVEFQSAIKKKSPFKMIRKSGDVSKAETKRYLQFISHYLYYFDVSLDERRTIDSKLRNRMDGKPKVMLIPSGAKNPEIFQRKFPINYCIYTHSLADFYKSPDL